jgi:hypothetical protein
MGGTSSIAFSYRIVGRRKDVRGHTRFAKFDTRLPPPATPPGKTDGGGAARVCCPPGQGGAAAQAETRGETQKIARASKLFAFATSYRRFVKTAGEYRMNPR